MKLTENFTLEELTESATARSRGIDNTPGKKEIENLKKLCISILQPIREKDCERYLCVTVGSEES